MLRDHRLTCCLVLSTAATAAAQGPVTGLDYPGAQVADAAYGQFRIADLDGDGYDDVVSKLIDGVQIERSLGDGRVQRFAATYPAGVNVSFGLELIDWNGDGALDVAAVSAGPSAFLFLFGDGQGGGLDDVMQSLASDGAGHAGLGAGDLDGDGHADLLTADSVVGLLASLGDGTGAVADVVASSTGLALSLPELADLDLDGVLDVVARGTAGGDHELTVLRGDGAGGFAVWQHLPASANVRFVLGDFDEDGAPDVVSASSDGGTLTPWLNEGGLLVASAGVPTPATGSLAAGDLDGDGHLDVLASTFPHAICVHRGDGRGGLATATVSETPDSAGEVSVLQLDGDGLPDLVTNGGLAPAGTVFHTGAGGGFLRLAPVIDLGAPLSGLAAGDLDGDGRLDVAACAESEPMLWILPGTGTEHFGAPVAYALGEDAGAVAIGDVTADGMPDVVVGLTDPSTPGIELLANDGTGGLLAPEFHATGKTVVGVALHDMDADGVLDVLTLDRAEAKLSLLLADGAGGLAFLHDWPTGFQPADLAVDDVDGDAVPDALVVCEGSDAMTVLLGRGDGTGSLVSASPVPLVADVHGFDLADLDLDGDLDVALARPSLGGRMLVYSNDGAGHFLPALDDPSVEALDAVITDVDQDGLPDVVTVGPACVGVHRGRARGGFERVQQYATRGKANAPTADVLAVDLEGSGFPDLLTRASSASPSSTGPITVLPNRHSPWWRLSTGASAGPALSLIGPLTPDSELQLDLSDGTPSGVAWVVVGLGWAGLPLGGGVLAPTPDVVLLLALDGQGAAHARAHWPGALPASTPFWVQPWSASPPTPGDAVLGVTADDP
ncbi:MAG: VCBS repeat-containing protein [Planctomycetes bacterium]|nr:VCBS repeat-containing protein [Planctomycetota bacterium]